MANLSTMLGSTFGGVQGTALVDDLTFKGGVASIVDGGTITHGLTAAPTRIGLTGSGGHIVTVTSVGATTITVSIKTDAGAAVVVAENVYWLAAV